MGVVLGLAQLGRARHEDPLGWREGRGGAEVDVVEGGRSDRRRGGRPHFLALTEAQVISQQGEDVGPEGAEGGEKVESSSFSRRRSDTVTTRVLEESCQEDKSEEGELSHCNNLQQLMGEANVDPTTIPT